MTVDGLRLAGGHAGQLWYLRELEEGRDRFLARVLSAATPTGGIAVDAGAHIGYFTLVLARAVGPTGHVYALEPDPTVAATLLRNVRRNGFSERVTVIADAAGAAPGRSDLHLSGGGETSSLGEVPGSGATASVDVQPIDEVVAGRAVDIVKLDVEGAEVLALAGMQKTLATRRSLTLAVECNPGRLRAMGTSPDALIDLLQSSGFTIWQLDEPGSRLSREIRIGDAEYVDLVCAKGEVAAVLAALSSGRRRRR